jgi:LmbE family N-acetylglucosaminyl deacetylase
MTLLVVAAHPDDEVLGAGGTMAKAAQQGVRVVTLILGEGITSRYAKREDAPPDALRVLHQNAHAANAALGVREVRLVGLPDNRFDTVPLLEVVREIETVIEAEQPSIVLTQHGGDLNVDHVVVFRAVLTATRPVGSSAVQAVYAYEVPSSTEWAFGRFEPRFDANTFVDISATLDAKVRAMESYESEARAFPHPRSPDALRAIARRWGSVSGLQSAEAFQLVRSVRPEGLW